MSLQALIEEKIRADLAPSHLDVINESGGHGNTGGESHFKVIVVSDKFDGTLVQISVPKHKWLHVCF